MAITGVLFPQPRARPVRHTSDSTAIPIYLSQSFGGPAQVYYITTIYIGCLWRRGGGVSEMKRCFCVCGFFVCWDAACDISEGELPGMSVDGIVGFLFIYL